MPTQSTAANSFVQGSTGVTLENAATCTASVTASSPSYPWVAPASVTVISPTKLAFTVPAGATATGGITSGNDYVVCAYGAPGAAPGSAAAAWTLVAKAEAAGGTYHVGATPTLATVSPKAAGTQGGGTLLIAGTGLDSAGTWSLGGTSVSPTVNGAGTLATVAIPAHAAGGPFSLVHTASEGGTATLANAFTYANGLSVTPNTSSNSKARTDVSVTGTNLSSLTFGTTTGKTPDDNNAHVYLVKGTYDPTKTGLLKANGQVTECLNVVVISDTELLCSLYLAGGGVPLNATRTVSATVSNTTLTAAAGNFGPGDVGQTVTGSTSLGANTYITAVIDPTRVTLNKAPTAAISTATTLTLNPARVVSDITFANNSTAVTSAAGAQFTSNDVGRVVSGTNLSGQYIAAVNSPTSATLSAVSGGASSGNYTITGTTATLPEVPVGTYTLTVVNSGAVDAQSSGNLMKSVINSGSTFTVADF